jgi:hypothetical protein
MECVDPGGKVKWKEDFHNLVTDNGMDYLLYRMFNPTVAVPALNAASHKAGGDWGGRKVPRFWPTNQAVALGEYIQPTTYNGYFFICGARTGGNTTGASEPSWVTTIGATTSDDEVTWYRNDWYVGIKSNVNGAAGDVIDSKGWTERTNYNGERKAWDIAGSNTGSGGRSVTSASACQFVCNGQNVVGGAFLTNFPIKGNATTGVLYGNGEFTDRTAESGDTLNVTVTVSFTTTADV